MLTKIGEIGPQPVGCGYCTFPDGQHHGQCPQILLDEAEAEIERLKMLLNDAKKFHSQEYHSRLEEEAENADLRERLTEAIKDNCLMDPMCPCCARRLRLSEQKPLDPTQHEQAR